MPCSSSRVRPKMENSRKVMNLFGIRSIWSKHESSTLNLSLESISQRNHVHFLISFTKRRRHPRRGTRYTHPPLHTAPIKTCFLRKFLGSSGFSGLLVELLQGKSIAVFPITGFGGVVFSTVETLKILVD